MFTNRRLYRPSATELRDYACLTDVLIEGITDHAFISRMEGCGMEAAGITDGDWLVFDPGTKPADGDIVSLSVYGRPMCRRVFFETAGNEKPGKVRIRREDNATPDLMADKEDVEIRGVFKGLVRNCRIKGNEKKYRFLSPLQAGQEKSAGRNSSRSAAPDKSSGSIQKEPAGPSSDITDLGLPARVSNCLAGIGMRTVQDILDVPDKEALYAIPGIGKAAYETILRSLEGQGFDVRHLRW